MQRKPHASTTHHQTTGQNYYVKVANKLSANVAKFSYLGMRLTAQNRIHTEIKRRLNIGSTCYHAVHKLWSHITQTKCAYINV
jgi:hypothetical protein